MNIRINHNTSNMQIASYNNINGQRLNLEK